MLKPFGVWMREVDATVGKLAGLSVHDLPDAPFADWWDEDMSPKAAARAVVREAM